ncbi:Acidic phosphoprotein precursor PCEMA1, putative [Plasmodium chabaudi adami]|uniref:Acidic phosphoprotein PCEMA1, putative n=1 Tax=Plasmodium chabaudi adami TaxID=5826 RepID=A0A1D3L9N7_PLACE|nr:Acidic phosphoprotein precursor PCEMA1, putative [Plasmodium chabaudi adami]
MIQQRYKDSSSDNWKYFYALATKADISEDTTIIVIVSADINDHNSKDKRSYRNKVIEKANLFKTDIDSEDDIRKGKLKKTFVNIAGCLVEKKTNNLDITYVGSVDYYASSYLKQIIRKALCCFFPHK